MNTRPIIDVVRARSLGLRRETLAPNLFDLIAFVLIIAILTLVAHSAGAMRAPLSQLDIAPVRLDPMLLPEYALRTTLRMFAAMAASLVFTFLVATLAAKSRKAELVIIPALDILQSVPVLGFLTLTRTQAFSVWTIRSERSAMVPNLPSTRYSVRDVSDAEYYLRAGLFSFLIGHGCRLRSCLSPVRHEREIDPRLHPASEKGASWPR
jgi:hypothetical protein